MVLVPRVWAADSAEWRFWNSNNGFGEDFIAAISHDATGSIWTTHGDLRSLSRFDGREIVKVPSPYSNNGRRFDSLDGKNGWAAEEDGLRHLQDGKWEIFPELKLAALTTARQQIPDFHVLDLGNAQALVLFADHLARFSAHTRQLERWPLPPPGSRIGRLSTFERAPEGGVWVVAEKGVARLGYPAQTWQEYPVGNLPVQNLAFPVACLQGEIFVTASIKSGKERVILRFRNGGWEMISGIPQSSHASLAWRDGSGDLWLASDLLYRKSAQNPEDGWVAIDSSNPILSGRVHGVIVNADGSFFMATPYGLALHVNLAWKTLTRGTGSRGNRIELKRQMTAMLEDRRQRLWILADHDLLRFERGQWEEFPLPPEYVLDVNQRNLLIEQPDGKILIQLQETPYLITFDPGTQRVAPVNLINGYRPITFCRRADGRTLVAMESTKGGPGALATFDAAGSLSSPMPVSASWTVHYPRGMIETAGGEVWVGGTAGLVRFANGQLDRFDWIETQSGGTKSRVPLQVFSMLADGGQGFLVGARQSLCRWTGTRLEFLSESPLIQNMARDRRGALWVSTSAGIRRLLDFGKSGASGPARRVERERHDGRIADDRRQRCPGEFGWTNLGHHR